jgi:glycosyltransferase involved in cell wall biosynthesis
VSVLIPARDEEKLLPRCLESVLIAKSMLDAPITSDILVVADSSTDRTEQIAGDLLQRHGKVVNATVGTAGAARAIAAGWALSHVAHRSTGGGWRTPMPIA